MSSPENQPNIQPTLEDKRNAIHRQVHPEDYPPSKRLSRRNFLALCTMLGITLAAGNTYREITREATPEDILNIKTKYRLKVLTGNSAKWTVNELAVLSSVLTELPESFYVHASVILLASPVANRLARYYALDDIVTISRHVTFVPLSLDPDSPKHLAHELAHRKMSNQSAVDLPFNPSGPNDQEVSLADAMTVGARNLLIQASKAYVDQNGIWTPLNRDAWYNFLREELRESHILGEWAAILASHEYFPDSARFRKSYGEEMFQFMKQLFEQREYKNGIWINR